MIDGKAYTVRSKAQYLGLLARSKRDQSRALQQAERVIERSQETAREALQARQVQETASLMQAVMAKEDAKYEAMQKKKKKDITVAIDEEGLPIEVLMLIGQQI